MCVWYASGARFAHFTWYGLPSDIMPNNFHLLSIAGKQGNALQPQAVAAAAPAGLWRPHSLSTFSLALHNWSQPFTLLHLCPVARLLCRTVFKLSKKNTVCQSGSTAQADSHIHSHNCTRTPCDTYCHKIIQWLLSASSTHEYTCKLTPRVGAKSFGSLFVALFFCFVVTARLSPRTALLQFFE